MPPRTGDLQEIIDFHTRSAQALAAATGDQVKALRAAGRLPIHPGANDPARTPGDGALPAGFRVADEPAEPAADVLVRSEAYRAWATRFPEGGPNVAGTFNSDPVPLTLRSLLTSADDSAGALVGSPYRPLIEPGPERPPTILQLLSIVPVTVDLVEYPREVSRQAAAELVAEAVEASGASGIKPEGGIEFELVPAPVRTAALHVPLTRRVVADATELRTYAEAYLVSDVRRLIEDQVIAGDGNGENFLGILEQPGIIPVGPPGLGEGVFHVIREGLRQVRTQGRTNPTAVLMSPVDAQAIDLALVNDEENHFLASPFQSGLRTLFGVPLLESEAVPDGVAIVGDFRRAVLFDREQSAITIGTINDDLIRNLVRLLCEARSAFGVLRPKAFAAVDLA